MSTIQDTFIQAQLAEAAYANFIDPQTGSVYSDVTKLTAALQNPSTNSTFSDAQVADFLATWKVVDQQPDTANGFSATVFRNKITGEYTFAIRGSTGANYATDFVADAKTITTDGVAVSQLVDMYNYWPTAAYRQGAISARSGHSNIHRWQILQLNKSYLVSILTTHTSCSSFAFPISTSPCKNDKRL